MDIPQREEYMKDRKEDRNTLLSKKALLEYYKLTNTKLYKRIIEKLATTNK